MRNLLLLSALSAFSAVNIFFSPAIARERAPHPRQAEIDSLFKAAQERINAGDASAAILPLQQIPSIDPKHDRAYLKLGDAYLLLKNLEEAESAFKKALSIRRSAEAYDGIGRALMEGNRVRTRQAIDSFRDALTLGWNNAEVHYHLALALWKLKDLDALPAMERAQRMNPRDTRIHLLLAEWHQYPPADLPKAIYWYERYLEARPDDLDVAHRLGDLYVRNQQYEKARDYTAALLERQPDAVRDLPVLALACLGQEDFEKAYELLSTYLERVDPTERACYEDIAFVGRPDEVAAYRAISHPEERRDFLQRFWTAQNPTPAESVNRRRLEHYRRVYVARTRYGERQTPWDRRGEVYIRFGEPDYRSRSDEVDFQKALDPRVERIKQNLRMALYGTAPAPPSTDAGGLNSFIDDASARRYDEIMDANALNYGPVYPIRSLTSLEEDKSDVWRRGMPQDRGGGQVVTRGAEERRASQSVAPSGENAVPWESWIYFNVGGGIEITFTDERMDGRYDYAPVPLDIPLKDIKLNLVTNAPQTIVQRAVAATPSFYQPEAAGPLIFGTCAAAFRGQGGKTRLEVYIGVPLSEIAYTPKDSERVAAVQRSVALFDRNWREVGRSQDLLSFADTVVVGKGPGAFIPGLRAFELTPGTYHLAVQVTDRTSGRMQAYRQAVRVDPFGDDSLRVSDIELAAQILPDAGPNPFVKNGLRVLPMPSRAYPRDQSVFLYCEVYNLKPDATGQTRYRVDYTIRSKEAHAGGDLFSALGKLIRKEQRKEETTVSYEFLGLRPTAVLHVEIRAQEAGPGDHVLRVSITDLNSGAKTMRETTFWVQK
jgi:GWxTD domain-containing protein